MEINETAAESAEIPGKPGPVSEAVHQAVNEDAANVDPARLMERIAKCDAEIGTALEKYHLMLVWEELRRNGSDVTAGFRLYPRPPKVAAPAMAEGGKIIVP